MVSVLSANRKHFLNLDLDMDWSFISCFLKLMNFTAVNKVKSPSIHL